MTELVQKLLDKGYDWSYIQLFLSIRDIGQVYIPYPLSRVGLERQYELRSQEQKKLIDEAMIEVDFLRPA